MEEASSFKRIYRPELDGLRAIAVIAVIVNHFNKELLPSGYLGVDIFFVISGYVITASLSNRQSKNFLDFITGFYERRIKRLFPALISFLIPTVFLICFFNPDSRLALRTAMSSIFGLSNLYLLHHSNDYFAQSTELNPFTHTWSLAVEEQFYFIFPFIIWITGFGRKDKNGTRNLLFTLTIFFVLSLISYCIISRTDEMYAYYLMPTRFWEMASGSIIFLISIKKSKLSNLASTCNPIIPFAIIFVILFQLRSFPVINTILIVCSTCWLILSLSKGTAVYNFLTGRKAIYIGKISYSLYLWHWGILCISRWTIGIHLWSLPFQLGIIFLIASISYKYIETPFRNKNFLQIRWKNILGGVTLMFSSLLPMLFLWEFQNEESRAGGIYLGDLSTISAINQRSLFEYGSFTSRVSAKCHTKDRKPSEVLFHNDALGGKKYITSKFIEDCSWDPEGDKTGPIFAFAGDSHTLAMFPLGEKIAKNYNFSVFSHSRVNCFFPSHGETIRDGCYEVQSSVENYLLNEFSKRNQGSVLIATNYLNIQFGYGSQLRKLFKKYPKGDKYSVEMNLKDYINKLTSLAKKLEKSNSKLIVVAPLPSHPLYTQELCNPQWFRQEKLLSKGCSFTEKRFLEKQRNHIYIALKELEVKTSNIFIYDAFYKLCDEKYCFVAKKGKPLYVDEDHLSKAGIEYIYPHFIDFLKSKNII